MGKGKTSYFTPGIGWECKYLSWFTEFIKVTRLGTDEMARKIGTSRQTITYNLANDNMSLQKAQEWMDRLGYKLELSYSKEAKEGDKDAEKPGSGQNIILVGFGENDAVKNKRLGFLQTAMKRYKFTMSDIANALGLCYNAVQKAMAKDDWTFQRLTQISESFGLQLNIKITKDDTAV